MSNNSRNRFSPLLMALCVAIGIVIGTYYANRFGGTRLSIINTGTNKLNNLLHTINDYYVDTVDINQLVEKAVPQILSELDPHSVYISAANVEAESELLKGSFSGIGIEFTIRKDTVHVQHVIEGGPSERAGLIAGDKIVMVDDSLFVGPDLTNERAMRTLKGPKGSTVKLSVVRYGEKKLRDVSIVRGEIPMRSVTSTYMLDEGTGYIKIKNFGEKTHQDLIIALARLTFDGLQNLVIDLRGNTGGYLQSAVQIANEFLPKGRMIVYTEGRRSQRQPYVSDGRGSYQHLPLIVLIDEGSASASEILAGAVQDNDRGTIIGRRSFGKGLVQQPIEFSDHSMMRLTIARYYSPSGRCIQKPYTSGQDQDYEDDMLTRYQRGEFFSGDSIKHTGPEYHTALGRTVYGGGGITPDIFVPEDTTGTTSYYKEAAMSGLIIQFAFEYTDENRQKLSSFHTPAELEAWLKKINIVDKFATYAESSGLKRRNLMIQKSHKLLERYLVSRLVYNVMGEDAFNQQLNADDPVIMETLRVFKAGEAFPKKPEPQS